jgi:DNA-binding NarL/FixJ family response regulator
MLHTTAFSCGPIYNSPMPKRIKICHLEDYKIIRDGIRFLLSRDEEISVVGEAQQPQELFDLLRKKEIDVLLLDIYLDGMKEFSSIDGFEVCRIMREKYPQVKIIAHSVYDDADRVARIMNAGAMGFVSKKAGYDELLEGIKQVHGGKKFICKETAKRLKNLNEFLNGIEDTLKEKFDFFSKREKEVLALLAKGFSTKEISKRLFITEKTVESHRKNLVEKAKVKNTVELIAYASMRGFINN